MVDLAGEPPTDHTIAEELDLGDLVDRVVDKYRRRTGRTISVAADSSLVIGREVQLERAVSNLVDNAAKWSPPTTSISVSVSSGRVSVTDQGPGIDPSDRPHIFDRFYRATKDRSTPGSGLGLSIVAKAAEDHGGSAFVEDSSTGAIVGFEIPVAAQDSEPVTSRSSATQS